MEIQIKRAVKAGNSSAVILPRAWLNRKVRVELAEKDSETILIEVIGVVKKHLPLDKIIGVYLVGSYARSEQSEESDIDVMVITSDVDMNMIEEGIYNILVISSELLNQKLDRDLLPVGQMIKEARPLINSELLELLDVKVTKKNVKWYLETTEDKLKIIKQVIEQAKRTGRKYLEDIVAYTLVLRIRTLHIIAKLIKNEEYSKKDFVGLIRRASGGTDAYGRYAAVKRNSEEGRGVKPEEAERLYDYLKNQLGEVKTRISL